MLDGIIVALSAAGRVIPSPRDKAELARIGRYYATESTLVWDAKAGRYDADATASTGSDTLFEHYARVVAGEASVERGAHSVFS
jgi:divinyl chlorophyllide a 8-vinyl-reductase